MTRICPICRFEFEPDDDHVRYCSDSCRRRAAEKLAAAVARQHAAPAKKPAQPKPAPKPKPEPIRQPKAAKAVALPAPTTRTCARCGKEFEAAHTRRLFCSVSCRDAAHRERKAAAAKKPAKVFERVCQECGREFRTANVRQVFCSRKCLRKTIDRRHYSKVSQGPVMRVCRLCGTEFRAVGNERYCSAACRETARATFRRTYQREWQRAHYERVSPTKRTCPACGREFEAKGNVTYCSRTCRAAVAQERNRAYARARYKYVTITAKDLRDAAEFEARVAVKLAELFAASTEIAPVCPGCPCEDDCYAGRLKCNEAILMYARLQVEEEMR